MELSGECDSKYLTHRAKERILFFTRDSLKASEIKRERSRMATESDHLLHLSIEGIKNATEKANIFVWLHSLIDIACAWLYWDKSITRKNHMDKLKNGPELWHSSRTDENEPNPK